MPTMSRTSIESMELLLQSKRVQGVRKVDAKDAKAGPAEVAIEIDGVAGAVDVVRAEALVTAAAVIPAAVVVDEADARIQPIKVSALAERNKKGPLNRPFFFR
jgi:hypothetical protein